ncbi:MAG: hypothetical protein KME16_25455 [Scytolyngbya sp. HA4215-MV1]|jgi:hypothetical protein|nr:hypothetical protein [Scytolyngbya sp. HA4215-MV1]
MVAPPPVLLVLDLSALMAGKTRAWQEFSRLGECYVPQAVLQEVQYLCNRASEVDLEQTAREFIRFYPASGWQEALTSATHPALQPPKGVSLSGRARLSQTIAECAYGLSQHQLDALVVLVANDQPLLKRIQDLGIPNLCGISVTALVQWRRTHQRPGLVNQQLQQMVLAANSTTAAAKVPIAQADSSTTTLDRSPPLTTRPVARPAPITSPRTLTVAPPPPTHRRSVHPSFISQMLSGLLAFGVFAIVLLIGWRLAQPTSFDRFWQTTITPLLPGHPPKKPAKPAPPPKH